jgi:hypothetical protein
VTPLTTLAPTTPPAPTTIPPTTAAPTTPSPTAPPTLPPSPDSIEELIVLLEADLARFGERTPDFLDELRGVEEENGRKQSDRAEELLRHMDEWVEEGELSGELVPLALLLLEPIAEDQGNDDGGPGNGNNHDDD